MNYLFRYLSTLKPAEIERLRAIDMTPRERETFELLVAMQAKHEATKEEATRRLRMSGAMFDKTSSTLLRAILHQMVPETGAKLLEHLVERAVYDLFLHELRRKEKETIAAGDRAKMREFYAEAFRVLHLRFSSDYPERLARQIAVKYRRLDPSPDTAIYIEASLIGVAIWTEASRRTGGDDARERLAKRLRRNDTRITEATGPIARYRQVKAWIVYYGQLKRNPDERMKCLRAAVELCEKHPDVFPLEEKVLTLCQIAEEYYFYRTDLATPLRMYRDLYQRYPGVLSDETYHTFKYIQLCLINGEYGEAERLLVEHFGTQANLEVHGGGRSKRIALLWASLLLLTDRYAEARHHLDDAVLLNQKSFYLQFEIECRMIHTALCYLQGDFDLAERRIPTHIKYLRSKGITYATSRYYPWFFKLAGALIDERTIGKKLAPKLEQKLDEYMEGAAAQYGVLLRKMRGMGAVREN